MDDAIARCTSPTGRAGRARRAGCSSGSRCPRASTATSCSPRRASAACSSAAASLFHVDGGGRNTLRLTFCVGRREEQIGAGIAILGELLRERWPERPRRVARARARGGADSLEVRQEVRDGTTTEKGTLRLKTGLAEMLKGGVIMDVTDAEQAKIAEDAGAVAVMALERVPVRHPQGRRRRAHVRPGDDREDHGRRCRSR